MSSGGPNRPNRPIRPRQGPGGRKRRVVIDSGQARPGDRNRQQRPRDDRAAKPATPVLPTGPLTVQSGVSVKDLSQALGIPVPKIITILMGLGVAKTVTQTLSDEEVVLIAAEVEREVTIKHAADDDEEPEAFEDAAEDLAPRPPAGPIRATVNPAKR